MENFDLVQVDEEDENKFYSGDAYVVLYAFNNGSRDSYMIYYWLVSESRRYPLHCIPMHWLYPGEFTQPFAQFFGFGPGS